MFRTLLITLFAVSSNAHERDKARPNGDDLQLQRLIKHAGCLTDNDCGTDLFCATNGECQREHAICYADDECPGRECDMINHVCKEPAPSPMMGCCYDHLFNANDNCTWPMERDECEQMGCAWIDTKDPIDCEKMSMAKELGCCSSDMPDKFAMCNAMETRESCELSAPCFFNSGANAMCEMPKKQIQGDWPSDTLFANATTKRRLISRHFDSYANYYADFYAEMNAIDAWVDSLTDDDLDYYYGLFMDYDFDEDAEMDPERVIVGQTQYAEFEKYVCEASMFSTCTVVCDGGCGTTYIKVEEGTRELEVVCKSEGACNEVSTFLMNGNKRLSEGDDKDKKKKAQAKDSELDAGTMAEIIENAHRFRRDKKDFMKQRRTQQGKKDVVRVGDLVQHKGKLKQLKLKPFWKRSDERATPNGHFEGRVNCEAPGSCDGSTFAMSNFRTGTIKNPENAQFCHFRFVMVDWVYITTKKGFNNNNVETGEVKFLHITATKNSFQHSTIDTRGAAEVQINCLGKGSCEGMVVKYEMYTTMINLNCGPGACHSLVFLMSDSRTANEYKPDYTGLFGKLDPMSDKAVFCREAARGSRQYARMQAWKKIPKEVESGISLRFVNSDGKALSHHPKRKSKEQPYVANDQPLQLMSVDMTNRRVYLAETEAKQFQHTKIQYSWKNKPVNSRVGTPHINKGTASYKETALPRCIYVIDPDMTFENKDKKETWKALRQEVVTSHKDPFEIAFQNSFDGVMDGKWSVQFTGTQKKKKKGQNTVTLKLTGSDLDAVGIGRGMLDWTMLVSGNVLKLMAGTIALTGAGVAVGSGVLTLIPAGLAAVYMGYDLSTKVFGHFKNKNRWQQFMTGFEEDAGEYLTPMDESSKAMDMDFDSYYTYGAGNDEEIELAERLIRKRDLY